MPTVHYNMGGVPTNWKTEVLTQDKDGKDKVSKDDDFQFIFRVIFVMVGCSRSTCCR